MTLKERIWFVGTIVAGAMVIFIVTLVHALWFAPQAEALPAEVGLSLSAAATSTSPQAGTPVRLRIPALGINAAVQRVGIGKTGNMAVPNNFTDVGWYRYGTAPGAQGSAVIDGHVNNGLGLDGVFARLSNIAVGDDVYVDTADNRTLNFTVERVEVYPYKEVPVDTIFNAHDAVRLNVITCDGAWVSGEKTYDHRLVVFATLKNTTSRI